MKLRRRSMMVRIRLRKVREMTEKEKDDMEKLTACPASSFMS